MAEKQLKRGERVLEESRYVTHVPASGGGSEEMSLSGPAKKAEKKLKVKLD